MLLDSCTLYAVQNIVGPKTSIKLLTQTGEENVKAVVV